MGSRKIQSSNKSPAIYVGLCIFCMLSSCLQPRAKTDNLVFSKEIPHDYKSLFNFSDSSLFQIVLSYNTKYRAPFALIDYKTKYKIIIFKVGDSITESLQSFIKVRHKYSNDNAGTIYNAVNESRFYLAYSQDTTNNIASITLNLFGDSIQNIIKSDTCINYYLRFNQISWSRNFNKNLDIYIEPEGNFTKTTRIPSSIMFIKHNNKVYFILFTVNNDDEYFDKHLLQNLLSK
jgi:hypothetical protein